jgi:hypothetical protein
MRNNILLLIAAILVLFSGCGTKEEQKPEKTIGLSTNIEGDSTLYGLACDGCTDSVLVFLSGKGGDPVTYDIIDARKRQHIIGHPNVGDSVCLIVNGKDKKKADLVIDLDQLKGEWVNLEKPVRRESAFEGSMPKMDEETKAALDSMLEQQMKPVEIGFALKRSYTAQPIGNQYSRNQSKESPVIYPTPKRYTEWHIFNGKLVLTERRRNLDNSQAVEEKPKSDTVDILLMSRDTLRIRYKDGTEKGYYRKE